MWPVPVVLVKPVGKVFASLFRAVIRLGIGCNRQSLTILRDSGINFECRTTVHWRDFELVDVERLALTLADFGVRRYAIQVARTHECLDPDYNQTMENAQSKNMLPKLIKRLTPYFDRLELRS